jgi:hypothetical protein
MVVGVLGLRSATAFSCRHPNFRPSKFIHTNTDKNNKLVIALLNVDFVYYRPHWSWCGLVWFVWLVMSIYILLSVIWMSTKQFPRYLVPKRPQTYIMPAFWGRFFNQLKKLHLLFFVKLATWMFWTWNRFKNRALRSSLRPILDCFESI